MPKFTVVCYAYVEYEVEAETPEEANEIAMNDGCQFDLVDATDKDPRITDMAWSWSDAMGSEVRDEEGDTVLCDW
jgi:hypothetical protein